MSRTKTHSKRKSGKSKGYTLLWIGLIVLLLGSAVYAGIYLEKNTLISDISFSGHVFTEEKDLIKVMHSPIGESADSIAYNELFSQLKSLPYIKDASVHMNFRGTLTFQVEEHQPLAMLSNGDSRTYIAKGGFILPVIPEKIPDVPLVYGLPATASGDTLTGDTYQAVEEFLLAAKKNDFGWITISEVGWNSTEGVVALTYDNGVKLIFGKDRFQEKFENWEAFYAQVVTRQGIESFHTIDLRYSGQIVSKNL